MDTGSHDTQSEATPHENDENAASTIDDADSALELDYISRQTQSLTGRVLDFRYECGRRYHAYQAGDYVLPNDEGEQDRLDLQHHQFRIALDGALYLAPIPHNLHHVLDVGCGTGIWSIEFADEHQSAAVLGIDISPIQPAFVPVNCSFRIDNVEEDWAPEESYDFIHSRVMIPGIKNWRRFIHQAFQHLKPGGYIELQDFGPSLCCQDAEAGASSKTILFSSLVADIGTRMGIDVSAALSWPEYLELEGFTDIHVQWYNWPIGPWAKHKKNKIIGKLAFVNTFEFLTSIGPAFQMLLHWSPEETEVLLAEVRKEMRERKLRFYQPVCFCYARKPAELPTRINPTTVPASVLEPEDVHIKVATAAPHAVQAAVSEAALKTAAEAVPTTHQASAP